MQAYKTEARIERQGELRLADLPFRAGDEVEVIVLRREPPQPTTGQPRVPRVFASEASLPIPPCRVRRAWRLIDRRSKRRKAAALLQSLNRPRQGLRNRNNR